MKAHIRSRNLTEVAVLALLVGISLSYGIPFLLVLSIRGWSSAGSYATTHVNSGFFSLANGVTGGIAAFVVGVWSRHRKKS